MPGKRTSSWTFVTTLDRGTCPREVLSGVEGFRLLLLRQPVKLIMIQTFRKVLDKD